MAVCYSHHVIHMLLFMTPSSAHIPQLLSLSLSLSLSTSDDDDDDDDASRFARPRFNTRK
jgi:hypothetical protein